MAANDAAALAGAIALGALGEAIAGPAGAAVGAAIGYKYGPQAVQATANAVYNWWNNAANDASSFWQNFKNHLKL